MKRIGLTLGTVCFTLLLWAGTATAQKQEALSDYFVVERVRSLWKGSHVNIYVRNPDGKLEYIGSTSNPVFGGRPAFLAELEESVSAVSEDGRSIVFRHFPEFAKGGFRREGGIYRYEYGKGAQLLHKDEQLHRQWTNWPKPLPRNLLVFHLKQPIDPQEVPWAVPWAVPLPRESCPNPAQGELAGIRVEPSPTLRAPAFSRARPRRFSSAD